MEILNSLRMHVFIDYLDTIYSSQTILAFIVRIPLYSTSEWLLRTKHIFFAIFVIIGLAFLYIKDVFCFVFVLDGFTQLHFIGF